MCGKRPLQLTLALLKPDLLLHPQRLHNVKKRIINENFWIIKWRILQWEIEEAEQFYHEHKGRFFYKRLISFMSSGPIMPLVLVREDAVNHWRTVMGPTKTTKAKLTHPESIRGLYGLSDTRNSTHGSDSAETAEKEIKHFFPDFNPNHWLLHEGKAFQESPKWFDEKEGIHKVNFPG